MAEPLENSANTEDAADDLRGKLLRRLAVAGVLVALLLGVLGLFDYLSNPPPDDELPVFTKPVPVAPRKEVSQPVKPNTDLPAPPPEASAPVEPPSAPARAAIPAAAGVPAPAGERPEIGPNSASTVAVAKAVPSAPPTLVAVTRPVPPSVPEGTEAPPMAPAPQKTPEAPAAPVAETTRPSARVVESHPAPVAAPQAPRLFSGFILQAGVFASMQRAEELHARLALSGVPSSVETRVQVGPFRTRQEAEAAQLKLRTQGIETVLVAPKGAGR